MRPPSYQEPLQTPEKRVWAVVLSSSIYEYFVRYLSAAAGVDPLKEFRISAQRISDHYYSPAADGD
ncbi:hypothetical protein OSCI_4090006 [Kamptonema sp. PCC 6506]|nr:hypothetical protein OSCI_4090006 [Kamptonema sp. PCC 6506]